MFNVIRYLISKYLVGYLALLFADVDMSPLMAMIYSLIPVVFLIAILKFIPKMLDKFGGR